MVGVGRALVAARWWRRSRCGGWRGDGGGAARTHGPQRPVQLDEGAEGGVRRPLEPLAAQHALQRVVELLHHAVAHDEQRPVADQRRQLGEACLGQRLRVHVGAHQPLERRPLAQRGRRVRARRVAVRMHDVLVFADHAVAPQPAGLPVDARLEAQVHPAGLERREPVGARQRRTWRRWRDRRLGVLDGVGPAPRLRRQRAAIQQVWRERMRVRRLVGENGTRDHRSAP